MKVYKLEDALFKIGIHKVGEEGQEPTAWSFPFVYQNGIHRTVRCCRLFLPGTLENLTHLHLQRPIHVLSDIPKIEAFQHTPFSTFCNNSAKQKATSKRARAILVFHLS